MIYAPGFNYSPNMSIGHGYSDAYSATDYFMIACIKTFTVFYRVCMSSR